MKIYADHLHLVLEKNKEYDKIVNNHYSRASYLFMGSYF
jgi:hypothetical protein